MYGLEAVFFNVSALRKLDRPLFNAVGKIFKTFDANTIKWCMYYLDCLPMSLEYKFRRIKFLSKMRCNKNGLIIKCFGTVGKKELLKTCNELKIDAARIYFPEVKQILWNNFCRTLT